MTSNKEITDLMASKKPLEQWLLANTPFKYVKITSIRGLPVDSYFNIGYIYVKMKVSPYGWFKRNFHRLHTVNLKISDQEIERSSPPHGWLYGLAKCIARKLLNL